MLLKRSNRKIYEDTNRWLNEDFKIKKIDIETRVFLVPNSNC